MNISKSTLVYSAIGLFLLIAGFYFRASGLFHGLEDGIVFHPDTPKQIQTLENYLEGTYVAYRNSLFYDGYPYGLNRVDEVLIRGVYLVARPLHRLFGGEGGCLEFPDRESLYYWARMLRVLYGMVSLVLVAAILYMLTRHKTAALIGLGLCAVSPLAATVTHSASGDIGIDLFLSFTLFFLALGVRRQQDRWIVAAGLAVGAAFACKYQGALGAWLVAITLLVRTPPPWKPWKPFFRSAFCGSAGFFAGAALLTPGMWIDPKTTLRLIRENFVFIKNYGVPREFLEKTFFEKVGAGLPANLPRVLSALGVVLVLISVITFFLSLKLRKQIRPGDSRRANATTAFCMAVSSFPSVAILLSTSLKPVVQPFHFSYLIPCLAVSAGLLASYAFKQESLLIKSALWILLLCSGFPLMRQTLSEDFYWRRGALDASVNPYILETTRSPLHRPLDFPRRGAIKQFYLHSSGLSVFRNRARSVSHPRSKWWRRNSALFVPETPLYASTPDWIFLNGPVFPRSDRYLHLTGGKPLRTHLVVEAPSPRVFQLGFRSGATPVHIHGTLGDEFIQLFLPPHSQTRVDVARGAALKKINASHELPDLELHRLQLEASPGDAVVAVLADEEAVRRFDQFGPTGSSAGIPAFGREELRQLDDIRYLEMDRSPHSLPLPPGMRTETLWLPAGRYRFQATLRHPGAEDHRFRVRLRDPSGAFPPIQSDLLNLRSGYTDIEWEFEKGFAPHEVSLEFDLQGEEATLMDWEIIPLPGRGGEPGPPLDSVEMHSVEAAFPHGLQLNGVRLHRHSEDPGVLVYAVHAGVTEPVTQTLFKELVVFLHILDENGGVLQTLDIPFPGASFDPKRPFYHHQRLDPGVADRASSLRLGLYSARTHLRLAPRWIRGESEGVVLEKKSLRIHSRHPLLEPFHLPPHGNVLPSG